MKTNILIIVCSATLLLGNSIAYSAEGPYLSANIGMAIPNDSDVVDSDMPGVPLEIESDNGLAIAGAFGYGFNKNIRLEAEIQYVKHDLDKVNVLGSNLDINGDFSSLAMLLNGYYDFANESAFTPFISAGLGFSKLDASDTSIPGMGSLSSSDDDTVFAYQFSAGVSYAVTQKFAVDGKYRYFATSDPQLDVLEPEVSGNLLTLGVTFSY